MRPSWIPSGAPSRLAVYVPRPGTFAAERIARGSGIVGDPGPDGSPRVTVYYEGDLYGAVGLETFAAKVRQAAGRLVVRYPTSARMSVPTAELLEVGEWDVDEQLLVVTDPDALADWSR